MSAPTGSTAAADAAFAALLDDLAAEEAELDAVVASLDDSGWSTPTPAEAWDVRTSIAHLAATEEWAALTLSDPERYAIELARLADGGPPAGELESGLLARRQPDGFDTLAWWRDGRERTALLLHDRGPKDRLAWFGPPMSAMSFTTARLMETWAHGQDVRDALGVATVPTARLRHVAELGVRTRGFSYAVRGKTAPDIPLRVELAGPDGATWTWGDGDAPDRVRGLAIDFCLVVTQRRNPADVTLEVDGPHAREWLSIAQAFAGPATDQRPAAAPVQ